MKDVLSPMVRQIYLLHLQGQCEDASKKWNYALDRRLKSGLNGSDWRLISYQYRNSSL